MKKHRPLTTTADGEEEDDYFRRLPDDVINDIFVRVNDCKLLTQCLLVSKRIASLIREVSSVSINIHLAGHVKRDHPIRISNWVWFRYKLISPSQQADISAICWEASLLDQLARLYNCKAREALHPFNNVKTAIVEYADNFNLAHRNTLRWMVNYSGGGVDSGIMKSCAFLRPISNSLAITTKRRSRRIIDCVNSLFRSAFTFLPMVAQIVQDHESLCDILVTTPSRKGWIHAAEDEIVKMRQAGDRNIDELMNKMMENKIHIKMKVWCVPILNKSIVYAFVVVSSPGNIDREVKLATRRFWGDNSYWAGHHDHDLMMIQEAGIERKMRELVEMKPCNFEYVWDINFDRTSYIM